MSVAAIRLHIEKLNGDRFLATSADVPGLVAEGRSVADATEIAQGLARKIAESCIEHGDPLPPALAHLREPEAGLDPLVPQVLPRIRRDSRPVVRGRVSKTEDRGIDGG